MSKRLLPLLLLVASPAAAFDVYLNNVKVTGGINNQTFTEVGVRIGPNGDVYIDAPGYRVEVEGAAPASGAPAAAVSTGRYWFFLEAKQVGLYRVALQVNGKPAADVPASSSQWVADLGPFFAAGDNQIQVTFLPVAGGVGQAGEAVSLLIGEGTKAPDGTLTISKVLKSLKIDAGKTSAVAWPLTITLP
jgi:hypothetical protein